ncbi:MAG: serpin family protein [Bacteroidaceae bacterium]|nr:serpin family protein [Bacteroidaceae bacterium]
MKTKSILLSVLFALSLSSCGDKDKELLEPLRVDPEKEELKPAEPVDAKPAEPETRHSYKPVLLAESQRAVHNKVQDFSWKLFKEVFTHRDAGTNLMVSPISLTLDLGMFINGLEGESLQEMLKTMGLESFSKAQINDYFKTMMKGIENADEAATFKSANSFWYNQTRSANQDFLSVIQTGYDAKTEAVDFTDPTTKDTINAWCAEHTNNLIPKMIDQTDGTDLFHLMNAVYFKALWEEPFDKELTQKKPFHYANGKTADVDMMRQEIRTSYAETDLYQQCVKPFIDGSFQMVFILPKEGVKLEDAIPSVLDFKVTATAEYYPGKPEMERVMLLAPKFKSEYTAEGLFRRMKDINPDLMLNWNDISIFNHKEEMLLDAIQKTYFMMDEEKVEAAAVTDIFAKVTSVPSEPIYMVLDRPFFYAIVETNTECPLFIGYYGE